MSGIVDLSIEEGCQFFSVGMEHSFQVYDCDPIRRRYFQEFSNFQLTHVASNSEATITCFSAIPIGSSNSSNSSNTLYIWSNFFSSYNDQISFDEPIHKLIIRGNYLIIILESSVCIYDLESQQQILEQVTDSNPNAAGDFISAIGFKKMAICGLVPGAVQVITIGKEGRPVYFQAHTHRLTQIRFSPDSSLISTASEEGTLIRLHDSLTGSCLSVYRRGMVSNKIISLCFSRESSKLIALSSQGTLHLFDAKSRKMKSDDDGERAFSKIKIEKEIGAEIAFKTDYDGIIIGKSGILRAIHANDLQIEITSSSLFLSH